MDKHVTYTPRRFSTEEQLDWVEKLRASHAVLKLDNTPSQTTVFQLKAECFAAKRVSNLFKEGS